MAGPPSGSPGRARMSELLAAVGNHEGKALTYLAMDREEPYGVSALHRRFLEIQGRPLAFEGTVGLQQKYVVHSLAPAGLAIEAHDGRFRRHTRADDPQADALAALLLELVSLSPFTLGGIFGRMTRDEPTAGPARRRLVLEALTGTRRRVSQAELTRRTGLDTALTDTVASLADAGVISYRTAKTYELKSSYRVGDSHLYPAGAGALTRHVVDLLNRRHRAEGTVVITRDEIEDHVLADARWGSRYMRDVVQRTMTRLADQGLVEVVESYRGQRTHSEAWLTTEQRNFATAVVRLLDAVETQHGPTMRRGAEVASQIVNDPPVVRRLLASCYGRNKVIVAPLSLAEKEQLVLEVLSRGPATSEEMVQQLMPGINRRLIGQVLSSLSRRGLIQGATLPRSPQKQWTQVEDG